MRLTASKRSNDCRYPKVKNSNRQFNCRPYSIPYRVFVLPLLIYVGLQAQLAVCETSAAFGQFDETPELTLIHGLRQRRLYSLAEIHAKRLLGSADQASPNFILLETELLKALTASAFESDSPIRRERVEAAIDQANTFSFEHAGHPNVVLVDVQRAVTELGFAELLQKEIEAGGNPSAREKMAFQYFRQCDNTLESCAKKNRIVDSIKRTKSQGWDDGSNRFNIPAKQC